MHCPAAGMQNDARMNEPSPVDEGNCRLASIPADGWPAQPEALYDRVTSVLAEQKGVAVAGPLTILVDMAPAGDPPEDWRCQIGVPITGLARPIPPMLVEDFHNLQALTLSHSGSIAEIAQAWQTLSQQAAP